LTIIFIFPIIDGVMSRTPQISAAAILLTLVTAACSGSGSAATAPDGKPAVVAAFYPLQWVAEQVGGSDVNVTTLTAPGVEPHDLELSTQQVAALEDATLTVYIKGIQPAVDDALAQDKAFDAASAVKTLPAGGTEEGHDLGYDPHIWLDPARMAAIAVKLGDRLATDDPAHAQGYKDRATKTAADLGTVGQAYDKGLATCTTRTLVTSHEAFGYLADRFRLKQIGITLDPEAEPSPARIAEVAKLAKAEKATTVFTETLVSSKVAEVLAKEVGAKTAVLDPLESKPQSGDFLAGMRANLQTLQTALGCAA
jgi:zinc transport system substrate-binding protein